MMREVVIPSKGLANDRSRRTCTCAGRPTKAGCPILSPLLRKGGIARTIAVRSFQTVASLWSAFIAGCPILSPLLRRGGTARIIAVHAFRALFVFGLVSVNSFGQPQSPAADPIAIVPIDTLNPDQGAKVTGALEVSQGKA